MCLSVCMYNSFASMSQCSNVLFCLYVLVFLHTLLLVCLRVCMHPFASLSWCLYVLFCLCVSVFVCAPLLECISVCMYSFAHVS